ncbi:MAG TPA: ABC transporter permease [Planctomycetota bacterium]|nr:ABC transporter permease [Planctomycetota bacterium]
MSEVFALASATARYATPLLFAASGGAISERGGIVNIALEGLLLGGAYAAVAGASVTDSTVGGLAFALGAGAALAALHALVTIRFRVNQIVSGVALNLLAAGLTKLLLQVQFHSASNSTVVDAAALSWGSVNPLIVAAFAAPFLAHAILERTTFGLRLRAAGEHPEAAVSLGIRVGWVRAAGVVLSGLFASLGGVYLSYDLHQFSANMTNGRGFMALAAVIFGGWRPLRALLACLLFAGLEAGGDRLQASYEVFRETPELVQVLPYAATLLVLAVTARSARAPAALGK